MRMDSLPKSDCFFEAVVFNLSRFALALAGVCWMSVLAVAQIHPAPVFQNPMEPSPLSQYASDGGIFGQASKIASPQPTNIGEVLYSRRVDLTQTLKKYAALKGCSLNEAFSKTTAFLRMFPHDQLSTKTFGASAYYQIVDKDVYLITAPQKFFDRLPAQLACVENGIRYIELKIRFISIPVADKIDMQKFFLPGTHVTFNNKLPQATPFATQASYRNADESKTAGGQDGGTMVMASETITKTYPTFMARMDQKGVDAFVKFIKDSPDLALTQSPTVRAIPGDPVFISDSSTRPFVVGVNRLDGDFTLAHQPIVQPIEEGAMLKIRAIGQDGKIRIDGDLALSTIERVSTFAYKDVRGDQSETVTVQVPEHRLKQVHLTTLVEEGKTIFIEAFGPNKVKFTLPKKALARNAKVEERDVRTLIMVTPNWVRVDDQNLGRKQK